MLRRLVPGLLLALAAAAAVPAAPAVAGDSEGPGSAGAARSGDGWDAFARAAGVRISGSPGYVAGSGNVGSSGTVSPPACWYQPQYTSAQAKAYLQDILSVSRNGGSVGYDWGEKVRALLEETGKQPYHEGEQGIWYGTTCSPAASADEQLAFLQGNPLFVWVGPGYPPPPGPQVTVEMLAEIARAHLRVPQVPVVSNPAAGRPSFVNLPTWLWTAPQAGVVRAEVGGLWAEVTATTTTLSISGPPAGATTFPAGGRCPGLGSPYRPGIPVPPCGLSFGRPARSVPVGMTVSWTIGWASSTGAGDPTWDTADIGQQQDFAVWEVQVPAGGR